MPRVGKSLLLWGGILTSILLINVFSLAFVYAHPPERPLPARVPAQFGSVAIKAGGGTEDLGYLDDGTLCLQWFVHVTDIHLNNDPSNPAPRQYGEFLNFTYDVVHPFAVFATGDFVSGSHPKNYTHFVEKPLEEMQIYFNAVNATPYATDPNPYRYVECAGNHDRNADWGAEVYLNYTLAGRRLGTVQNFFTANFSSGTVAYAAIDSAGPMEAPPVPLGSEGNLDSVDLDEYARFLAANDRAEHKFTFQHHFPVETFGLHPDPGDGWFRDGLGFNARYNVDAVFYGHSHFHWVETWGDQVHIMGDRWRDRYTDEATGALVQFYYHLVSVDGGGVNVANVPYSHLPNMIITNPSNPVFLGPQDSITNTRGDGHVRALIFASASDPVALVQCQVDGGTWHTMTPYGSLKVLFESARATPLIPDDGRAHTVTVRARTSAGVEVLQQGEVAYQPRRIWVWQAVVLFVILAIASIVIVCNKENLPLKRADGRRRRLSHAEKVQRRVDMNQQRNKPWWLPILSGAVLLTYLFVPWGIFPLVQGAPAAAYTFWVVTPISTFFTIETVVYALGKLVLVFPLLYHGVRKYHPELVNLASILLFVNCGFMGYMAWRGFALAGLLMPEVFFDFVLATSLFIGNIKHTRGYRWIARKLGRGETK